MEESMNNPYSKKALEELSKILQVHRSLIWVDPVTNSIAVKQVFDRASGEQSPPVGVVTA